MINLKLVGAGALGSVLAEEIAKSAFSNGVGLMVDVYDFDDIEDRNCASQNFNFSDIGKLKADVVCEKGNQYQDFVTFRPHKTRLEENNIEKEFELDKNSIILDLVDNIPTRQLLWLTGMSHDVPVLHAGMTQQGHGVVSWNYRDHDTFPFSPANCDPKYLSEIKVNEPKKLPPCELNAFRGLILQTVLATRDALFLLLGIDITGQFDEIFRDNGGRLYGLMTYWNTTIRSSEFDPNFSTVVEWNPTNE